MSTKPVVVQLAKAPIEGHVKTRMFPALSPYQASVLHKKMVCHCLEVLANHSAWRYELWIDQTSAFFDELGVGYPIRIKYQSSGDLGQRLVFISEQHFSTSKQKEVKPTPTSTCRSKNPLPTPGLVMLGSDCPALDAEKITKLISALEHDDLAIIPAFDGGYVAIAVAGHYPELFQGVDWGTDQVLLQTRLRAEKMGLNMCLFSPLPDIDRPEDLRHLAEFGIVV